MKTQKMLVLGIAIFALSFSLIASALSFVGAGTTTTLNVVEQYAYFHANYLTESCTGYGTVADKHIKQAYVRIREGNYDSGRVRSAEATSITDNSTIWVSTSRFNNPFKTMYTNYGWYYFS